MWIVSSPTCVGKSYFLENKGHRYSQITNLPFSGAHIEYFYAKEWNKIEQFKNKNLCIHLHMGYKDDLIHPNWNKICKLKHEKKVIILGISQSEYKIRVEKRLKKYSKTVKHNFDEVINLYQSWINDLDKKGISYLFVEAKNDYKILDEKNFFRMLI
tara:strand:+ start:319 stop:789 length:471 start_codon:yes stop_codon:yes gene_type:complete